MESWKVPPFRYNDVDVNADLPVIMRDGVTLLADVFRPTTNDKLPVLLMRTPYDKKTAQTCVYLDTMWYARYGYIVVVQDCRGRFASEGEWYPYRQEAEDGEDTVLWASKLPGCNGEVAMYGFSYPGALQLMAATQNLPELCTIMPAMTSSNFYEPWTYEGGAFAQGFVQSWALSLGRDTALRAGNVTAYKRMLSILGQYNMYCATTPLNALMEEFREFIPYYFDWVMHDTYDDYWRAISIKEKYDDIFIPALHVGGWYDIFLSGTIQNFMELESRRKADPSRGRQKLVVGPWHHVPWQPKVGCVNFGADAENIVDLIQLRWLDQQMRGVNQQDLDPESTVDSPASGPGSVGFQPAYSPDTDDPLDDPNVSVFVLGANKWQHFETWPPEQAKELKLYLHSNGRANATAGDGQLSSIKPSKEPWDSFIYDPTAAVPSAGGHSCCFEDVLPMGACDQSANQGRNDILIYSTDPLADDVTIAGAVSVELFASSSVCDTDFTAILTDVDPAGKAINICNGIIRTGRITKNQFAPLIPGQIYSFTITLGWTAACFKRGHRMRIEISSSNFPHYDRNPNTGNRFSDLPDWKPARQIIYHDDEHPSALLVQSI